MRVVLLASPRFRSARRSRSTRSSRSALPDRIAFLSRQPFAHRGLHGGGIVENSRAAFRAAIAVGHGIECDVQAAGDGEAFVFHDYELGRLTEEGGAVADRASDALATVRLKGTDETLPRLAEILALVAGQVPLLIEVKARDGRIGPICEAVHRSLKGYQGSVAVMSFNPMVGHWFRRQAPGTVRGLVVTEEDKRGWRGAIERHLSFARAAPDFLAYDVRDFPSGFASAKRARGVPVLTWTVRDAAAKRRAFENADQIIYETRS